MLFSSPEFIFGFLPVTILVYFLFTHNNQVRIARYWLLLASLFFYAYWKPENLILIGTSMTFNYLLGGVIARKHSKPLLTLGIIVNVAVLVYFKYIDFFIVNVNDLTGSQLNLLNVVLPLGVSFFTFQQIAYLVDSYNGKRGNHPFQNYCLFITFFPHLIAGPIVHHGVLLPQLEDTTNTRLDFSNFSKGIFLFNIGLAKKVIIADTVASIVSTGYSNTELLTTAQAWITSLAYSVQLYFDFSGYSDMAIGLALLVNIRIPINFDSPYKAVSIQDFWRRWHITLSQFLRDYLYIPLGGNRKGEFRTSLNLIITFLIGGIWHGAGWTFLFWGFLHGAGQVVHRNFKRLNINVPDWLGIVLTFLFINVTWVFFRAPSWGDAINVLEAMIGMQPGGAGEFKLINDFYSAPIWIAAVFLLFGKNSNTLVAEFEANPRIMWRTVALVVINMVFLNSAVNQEFLYFDF